MTRPPAPAGTSFRLPAIDAARFAGIFLVYYGHVVQRIMEHGGDTAALQYKFVYSFHIPLFFIISGLATKDLSATYGFSGFVGSRFKTRIVPLVFFNALLAGLSLGFPRFDSMPLDTARDYVVVTLHSMILWPIFNVPTWFLLCLVVVETIHWIAFRFLRASDFRIATATGIFLGLGYGLNDVFEIFPHWNFWLWNEALLAYGFYLLGVLVRRRRLLDVPLRTGTAALAAAAALAAVWMTYDNNDGPFKQGIDAVVMLFSAHGELFWFVFTALAGSCAVLFLAKALEGLTWIGFLGRNTLVLLGLNGVFHHHVNGVLAGWLSGAAVSGAVPLAIAVAAASAASIALSIPFVFTFNRWIPKLVGKWDRN